MAISAGKLVVGVPATYEKTDGVRSVQPVSPVEPTSSGVSAHPREAVLIVNGKEKKIGKKSRYLLDMLSLDE